MPKTKQNFGRKHTKHFMISIITPAYKQKEFLEECIKSVDAQTYTDWEHIIIDDGSPDNPYDLVKPYINEKRYFISSSNKQCASARNTAIRMAKGEYILPLDADDTLEPTFLEKCIEKIKTCDIVATGVREFGNSDKIWIDQPTTLKDFLLGNRICVCSLYKKIMWEIIGGYDEKMFPTLGNEGYEDWDFWIKAVEKGFRIGKVYEPLFNYRVKDVSMITVAKSNHEKTYQYIINNYLKRCEK